MLPDSKKTIAQRLGSAGEYAVGRWLEQQQFSVLAYNYRTMGGEVDVIAQKNDIIAFVEVKVRTHDYFNSSQVIIPSKQKKIIKTAQHFCMCHRIENKVIRFDVALLKPIENSFEITYISNAFTHHDQGWL